MGNNYTLRPEIQERLKFVAQLTPEERAANPGMLRKMGIIPGGRPAYDCPTEYNHTHSGPMTYEYTIGRDT